MSEAMPVTKQRWSKQFQPQAVTIGEEFPGMLKREYSVQQIDQHSFSSRFRVKVYTPVGKNQCRNTHTHTNKINKYIFR